MEKGNTRKTSINSKIDSFYLNLSNIKYQERSIRISAGIIFIRMGLFSPGVETTNQPTVVIYLFGVDDQFSYTHAVYFII
jgi:hypothetical protein